MTLEQLNLPAAELNKDIHQLQKLLKPLAHQPNSSNIHASALRRWFANKLPADMRACRGYVVGDDLCSNIQDVILFNRDHPTLYEESGWKMVPAHGVKSIIRVIGGSLPEPALVKVLREFAHLGQTIRSRSEEPLALGLWAPEAEAWSVAKISHLIQLIGESNPIAYTTHLAIGGSLYFQLSSLGNAKPEFESINLPELNIGNAEYVNGAMLATAILSHIETPYSYPFEGDLKTQGELIRSIPSGMAIPSKKIVSASPRKERIIPAKRTDIKLIPQQKLSSAIMPYLRRLKNQEAETLKSSLKYIQQDAKGNTSLHQMVLDNNQAGVANILRESKAALVIKNKEGNTPLHLACELGFREIVLSMLVEGPDVNARNYKYATPLHLAVEAANKRLIKPLVEAGAEIETRNNLSQTSLHLASIKGQIACSKILLESGADISAQMEKGIQPIHLAAWYGEGKMIQTLLDTGADINTQNEDGNTSLHFAAFNSQVKAIKILIKRGADPSLKNQMGCLYLEGLNEGYQGEINRLLE